MLLVLAQIVSLNLFPMIDDEPSKSKCHFNVSGYGWSNVEPIAEIATEFGSINR